MLFKEFLGRQSHSKSFSVKNDQSQKKNELSETVRFIFSSIGLEKWLV